MDAISLLTTDHEKVRGLFEDFRSAHDKDDGERMRSLQSDIFDELDTHTRIEEDIFYPAVRDLDDEIREHVAESLQEHHVVKVLMREISELSAQGDQEVFVAKMQVLIENVEHHADEEETEFFPMVRKQMDQPALDELGSRLESAKR